MRVTTTPRRPFGHGGFDHVIVDTAPAGHTLRLLQLPAAWTMFFENKVGGNSCLGPLSGLTPQRKLYESALEALSDRGTTALVLVSRAEATALREAERTSGELAGLGIKNQYLVSNELSAASLAATPAQLPWMPAAGPRLRLCPKGWPIYRESKSLCCRLGSSASRHFGH